jgi:hypothetical protein
MSIHRPPIVIGLRGMDNCDVRMEHGSSRQANAYGWAGRAGRVSGKENRRDACSTRRWKDTGGTPAPLNEAGGERNVPYYQTNPPIFCRICGASGWKSNGCEHFSVGSFSETNPPGRGFGASDFISKRSQRGGRRGRRWNDIWRPSVDLCAGSGDPRTNGELGDRRTTCAS